MDVAFWIRTSASTSNTLHVLSAINSLTFLPRRASAIDGSDDGLGQTQSSYRGGNWVNVIPVRDRPVSGARHSVLMKVPDRSSCTILPLQQNSSVLLKSLTIDGVIVPCSSN